MTLVRLLLLFTLVPLIELALLIQLGRLTSLGTTIAVVVLTGAAGAYLARREGFKTWTRIQDCLRRGVSPADELLDGLLILVAGVVLVTPGLITDLLGFMLLIAPLRRRLRRRLAERFKAQVTVLTPDHDQPPYDVIDMPPE